MQVEEAREDIVQGRDPGYAEKDCERRVLDRILFGDPPEYQALNLQARTLSFVGHDLM